MAVPARPVPAAGLAAFRAEMRALLPAARVIEDDLRRLAYGTDASFYRLVPQLVLRVESEGEVQAVLRAATRHGVAVTFRAAGTSLSGQAVTDSVLVQLGAGWTGCVVSPDAALVRLQPGVIGGHANRRLAPHRRKIGPDPASINAAMIGGIAANNASGMCCGTAQNSYQTLAAMRVILADGTLLDTADEASCAAFRQTHAPLLRELAALARRVREDTALAGRIRRKYRLKNTTGYGINALVDFEDPVEILQHLMIGSEGTLGFIAEITLRTVPEHADKATTLALFRDMDTACRAVSALAGSPVTAVELIDRAGLRAVAGKAGVPPEVGAIADDDAAALLIETRGGDAALLAAHRRTIEAILAGFTTLHPVRFTADPVEYERLWNVRKGLFPAVGANRRTGTTVIIEDVAFPVDRLADAVHDLQAAFARHGYPDAILFGHALEGNLHFVFTQDFGTPAEVERYRLLMDDVCDLVVRKYDGSLKAEHGTGRNMAPFVALEWGEAAYGVMREIKALFDPQGVLNPGVILNDDPQAHLRHLKPLPATHEAIDRCIECGFCEPHCPSRTLTLTPRQRIVVAREMARTGEDARGGPLTGPYAYLGEATCAGDGLCGTACPVGIDTGSYIRARRAQRPPSRAARWAARNFAAAATLARTGLGIADLARRLLGRRVLGALGLAATRLSGGRIPAWHPHLPRPAGPLPSLAARGDRPRVVYFPACAGRILGPSPADPDDGTTPVLMVRILQRAGFDVVYPEGVAGLCCGLGFASQGMAAEADDKFEELARALESASRGGQYPIVSDASACLLRMRERLAGRMEVQDPTGFLLGPGGTRLDFRRVDRSVALHVPCSATRMGLGPALGELARRCAREVVVPEGIGCCGFGGDRGFQVPELNAAALGGLRAQVQERCSAGYSLNRTCEIGLARHGGVPYRSLLHLVEEATRPDARKTTPTGEPQP